MKRIPFRFAASTIAVLTAGMAATGVISSTPVVHASATYPVVYKYTLSDLFSSTEAVISPTGSNIPCTPSAAHPYPVVLVHGTFENEQFNWSTISPLLADNGYCVYAFNYGQVSTSNTMFGQTDIAASAAQLATEVNTVLAETGASKVDIVGHSQGGMMPRYYINNLGGSSKVNQLVGLAPSNNGTTASGFGFLAGALDLSGTSGCTSCVEQIQGSSFIKALDQTNDGVLPNIKYTVIETTKDEIVTPYTSAFLTGSGEVQNITIQNQCPSDPTEHLGLAFDYPATQDLLAALGGNNGQGSISIPSGAGSVVCSNYGEPF